MLRSDDNEEILIHDWTRDPESGYISRTVIKTQPARQLNDGSPNPLPEKIVTMTRAEKMNALLSILEMTVDQLEAINVMIKDVCGSIDPEAKQKLIVMSALMRYTIGKVRPDMKNLFRKFIATQLIASIYYLTGQVVFITEPDLVHCLRRKCNNASNKQVVHCFTQLQSVIRMFTQINALLECPFDQLKLHEMLDGCLVYNLMTSGVIKAKPKPMGNIFN